MEDNLLGLLNLLRGNKILISFSGRFSQGIIEELGDALKKYMEAEDTPKNEIFNVFSVFIEQTQNIKNYAYSKMNFKRSEEIANSGIVTIGRANSGYFVWSGNLIENNDVDSLKEKLSLVNSLDKTELKKLYKEQLKKPQQPDTTGAGVGIIDMARKSASPILYSFNRLDDELSFFELRVIV